MKLSTLKTKFKNKWVLARVTKQDQLGQPQEVEPLNTSKSRSYINQKLSQTQEKHITVLYTGDPKPRI